jgi:hypothetical protein
MQDHNDARLAELQAKHTKWDIWYVLRTHDPTAWCCKPKGMPIATHQEDSAGALGKWLGDHP